jgi:small subunit ribosomal protein S8
MSTTTTDPIADMLSRIRNAIAVHKEEITLPHSNVKESVAKILKDNKFVEKVNVEDAEVGKILRIKLTNGLANSNITEIERMSTPGRRMYSGVDKIPTVKRGRGIVIVSTSKGMMTGQQAKQNGLGGELICKVY